MTGFILQEAINCYWTLCVWNMVCVNMVEVSALALASVALKQSNQLVCWCLKVFILIKLYFISSSVGIDEFLVEFRRLSEAPWWFCVWLTTHPISSPSLPSNQIRFVEIGFDLQLNQMFMESEREHQAARESIWQLLFPAAGEAADQFAAIMDIIVQTPPEFRLHLWSQTSGWAALWDNWSS